LAERMPELDARNLRERQNPLAQACMSTIERM
jgi:hypothetical protein